ncbi:MAG: RelA/SpoT domain-containing protein [Kiritimatiellales bacterium]|jgi:ppGpp synthetase/RelA/SpoT-type nucleotidyltranferase
MAIAPTQREAKLIDALVEHYVENSSLVLRFTKQVLIAISDSAELQRLIHSVKYRTKDPAHLRDKLFRKLEKCKMESKKFDINKDNLFEKISDLGGIRILHLYTKQIQEIDTQLRGMLEEMKITIAEGPFARTWDDEYRNFFSKIGISTQPSPTMYTSVHYVVASNSRTLITCEIQVRTLMEEVWGEVDHAINYPHKNDSVACTEQIRALARSTSSATRLVDAIFTTVADIDERKTAISPRNGKLVAGKKASRPKSAESAKKRG